MKARIEEFNDLAGHQEIHKGMTSRDLTENVEQLQIFSALRVIRDKAVATLSAMSRRAVEWRELVISKQEVGSSMLGEILTRKGGKRAKLPFRGTIFQIYSTTITMKYI